LLCRGGLLGGGALGAAATRVFGFGFQLDLEAGGFLAGLGRGGDGQVSTALGPAARLGGVGGQLLRRHAPSGRDMEKKHSNRGWSMPYLQGECSCSTRLVDSTSAGCLLPITPLPGAFALPALPHRAALRLQTLQLHPHVLGGFSVRQRVRRTASRLVVAAQVEIEIKV